ncbi:lipopolysaccharide assembly LapA domain-containing protein [Gordonia sp. (in: high G+C Gram-positive bacteria)]|uniref:LapA family protein n=1 Tax=Gordonia sp. (in: high G+C Gram-positive bacteria) TaxID=84139 RepID=UPI0026264E1C|nr:lipopolysaccharide assembly protein LapA domain-containing protein [Gordonia sp. (in: high G+C Gram-positive bacteria)]
MTTREPGDDAQPDLPATSMPADPPPAADPDDPSARERRALNKAEHEVRKVAHTRSRATYAGWFLGLLAAILLLVFILENQANLEINLIFGKVDLPVGVALLIAAILGAVVTLAISFARIMELRRALKKVDQARKAAEDGR